MALSPEQRDQVLEMARTDKDQALELARSFQTIEPEPTVTAPVIEQPVTETVTVGSQEPLAFETLPAKLDSIAQEASGVSSSTPTEPQIPESFSGVLFPRLQSFFEGKKGLIKEEKKLEDLGGKVSLVDKTTTRVVGGAQALGEDIGSFVPRVLGGIFQSQKEVADTFKEKGFLQTIKEFPELAEKISVAFIDELSKAEGGFFRERGEKIAAKPASGTLAETGKLLQMLILDLAEDPTAIAPLGRAVAEVPALVGRFVSRGKKTVEKAGEVVTQAVDVVTESKTAGDLFEAVKGGRAATVKRNKELTDQILNPKRKPDTEELRATAERIGIDKEKLPEAIEFGELSQRARAEKAVAQGEKGTVLLENHAENLDKVQKGIEKEILTIGKQEPLVPSISGPILKGRLVEGLRRVEDKITMSHKKLMKENKGLKIDPKEVAKIKSKMRGIEKFAKGRAKRGLVAAQRTTGENLLNAVESLKNTKASYKQINEAREFIGEVAFETVGSIEKVKAQDRKFRELYFTLNDALMKTADNISSEVGKQLRESNKIIKGIMDDKGVLTIPLGDKDKAGEIIFATALSDSRKAQAVKNILTPDELQNLKGDFLESLTKRDGSDNFTAKSFLAALNRKKHILPVLFEPDEIKMIHDIAKLGERMGAPIMPGSAGSLGFGLKQKITSLITEKVIEPIGDIQRELGAIRARRGPELPKIEAGQTQKAIDAVRRLADKPDRTKIAGDVLRVAKPSAQNVRDVLRLSAAAEKDEANK